MAVAVWDAIYRKADTVLRGTVDETEIRGPKGTGAHLASYSNSGALIDIVASGARLFGGSLGRLSTVLEHGSNALSIPGVMQATGSLWDSFVYLFDKNRTNRAWVDFCVSLSCFASSVIAASSFAMRAAGKRTLPLLARVVPILEIPETLLGLLDNLNILFKNKNAFFVDLDKQKIVKAHFFRGGFALTRNMLKGAGIVVAIVGVSVAPYVGLALAILYFGISMAEHVYSREIVDVAVGKAYGKESFKV